MNFGNTGNDVHGMRGLYLRRMPGIAETLIELHSDAVPEVKSILRQLHALVSAAEQGLSQGNPTGGLLAPLNALSTAIDRNAFIFITSPELFTLMCNLRHFVAITVGMVAGGLPAPPASASAIVAPRVHLQLQQLLPLSSLKIHTAQQPRSQPILLPTRQTAQTPQKRPLPIADDDSSDSRVIKHLKTPKKEMDKCDHCDLIIEVDEAQQFKHMWKKHKHLVYKFIKPELVCTAVPYCDYVASSLQARKIHEGKIHGKHPADQDSIIQEFERTGNCPYCNFGVNRIGFVKKHMQVCPCRDERPFLGCSSCPGTKFHFVFDFTTHLRANGGVNHGKPVLL